MSLQVVSQSPIKEGDNVTLKCQADGNPPPTSFNFNIKVRDHWPCPQQPRRSFISRVLQSALHPSLQVNYTGSLSLSPSLGQEGHSDGQGCLHSDWRYPSGQWHLQVLPAWQRYEGVHSVCHRELWVDERCARFLCFSLSIYTLEKDLIWVDIF